MVPSCGHIVKGLRDTGVATRCGLFLLQQKLETVLKSLRDSGMVLSCGQIVKGLRDPGVAARC